MKRIIIIGLLLFSTLLIFNSKLILAKEDKVIALAIFDSEYERNIWQQKVNENNLRLDFDHIFYGFTFETTIETLNAWKDNGITVDSLEKNIKIQTDSNFSIIGAPQIHRVLDSKNNYLTGKGVTVGIIDTGINYSHRDLNRNYVGGKDLVDQDKDPMETKEGKEFTTSHGTHVAGIIAANGQMVGVAPNAHIISYRALGPMGNGTTEQVLAAIEEAIADKVDILNLSLGTNINSPDLPITLALNKAVEKGIVVVVAAGNSGPDLWTVGSPGTARDVITVGASTPKQQTARLIVNRTEITMLPMLNSINWVPYTYPIVDFGQGNKEIRDLTGKIALIERGIISFTEKAKNAYKNGAIACLIYNNEIGIVEGSLEEKIPIPVFAISDKDGQWLKEQLKEEEKVLAKSVVVTSEDELANFSSKGPVTHYFWIKPDVVAPGVAIESTVPSGYAAMQGTSMAAPHVTGASAIIKQAYPNWTPNQIKSALMNTAKILKNYSGESYKVYEQGAGRIQLKEAINTKTFLFPSSLSFGRLTGNDWSEIKVVVENISDREQRYSFELPKRVQGIEWNIPKSFYLLPGEKKELPIAVKVNVELIEEDLLDGYLTLQSSNQTLTLPYLIVAKEPDYPRMSGLSMQLNEINNELEIEIYFPEEVEELIIVSFDSDYLLFERVLAWEKNVPRGTYKKVVANCEDFMNKTNKLKIFVNSRGVILEKELSFEK